MGSVLLAASSDFSYRAGVIAGRLILLIFLPVLLLALIYWLSGRSGPTPIPFRRAITRWWVWVAGLLLGIVLLLTLAFLIAANGG
ncbi:MAG TPA: hypothetical protein VFR68_12410 [Candidatus Dormibacteraeota bacterium]|nr:hypothetical protein [Candidatus Dormibacteraeota bacterium]